MKTTLFFVMICAAMTLRAGDSPLVKAAKANGGAKKLPHKVITNADVKKSKGKLVVLPAAAGAKSGPVDNRGPLQKQDDDRRLRLSTEARLAKAQKSVDDLQKELQRIEDAYYAENDPNYRDSTIVPRFNQTKTQLDEARKQLADARDAADRAKGKPSS